MTGLAPWNRPNLPAMSGPVKIADVLLPLKLDHPYSYRIADEESVNAGDYVRVPLGPRYETGVVWAVREAVPERPLKAIAERLDVPPMRDLQRRFVEWVADYYVAQRARVLALAAEGPPLTAAELARLAGVSSSVVRGLADCGALEPVPLPKDVPFDRPDPAAGLARRLSAEQEAAAHSP